MHEHQRNARLIKFYVNDNSNGNDGNDFDEHGDGIAFVKYICQG